MTTRALRRALRFVELSDLGSGTAKPPGKLGKGDQVDVLVRRESGEDWIMRLSPKGRETLIADAWGAAFQSSANANILDRLMRDRYWPRHRLMSR